MVEVNKTVQFNDTSTGTITSSKWDFGDGSPAITGSTVTHVYTATGSYTVTHTVVGSSGQSQSCVGTISVTPPAAVLDWKTPALIGTAVFAAVALTYAATKSPSPRRSGG